MLYNLRTPPSLFSLTRTRSNSDSLTSSAPSLSLLLLFFFFFFDLLSSPCRPPVSFSVSPEWLQPFPSFGILFLLRLSSCAKCFSQYNFPIIAVWLHRHFAPAFRLQRRSSGEVMSVTRGIVEIQRP